MSDLQTVLDTHRQAVQAFLASARAVSPERWNRPCAEGKWSPGQIAEHLALSYEASVDVIRGRATGPAAPRLLRPLLRTLVLQPVLWLRRFPLRSKSPAVLQPGASPAATPVLLNRLQTAAAALESEAVVAQRAAIDHPAFGRLLLVDFLRLQEIHTQHHCGQLPSGAT